MAGLLKRLMVTVIAKILVLSGFSMAASFVVVGVWACYDLYGDRIIISLIII